jgi:hypothetical protein
LLESILELVGVFIKAYMVVVTCCFGSLWGITLEV